MLCKKIDETECPGFQIIFETAPKAEKEYPTCRVKHHKAHADAYLKCALAQDESIAFCKISREGKLDLNSDERSRHRDTLH